MLSIFKKKAEEAVNKYQGRTDFLEAVCAGCALTAAADGDISDAEVDSTTKTITQHPALSAAFSKRQIEDTMVRMLDMAKGGRSGRLNLSREIEDIAEKADPDMNEAVLLAAWDVAESGDTAEEREVSPEERKVLEQLATKLHLDIKKYEEV